MKWFLQCLAWNEKMKLWFWTIILHQNVFYNIFPIEQHNIWLFVSGVLLPTRAAGQYLVPILNYFVLRTTRGVVLRNSIESEGEVELCNHSIYYIYIEEIRFSQFSGCWLILSVYMVMGFDFPFVRLFGVR